MGALLLPLVWMAILAFGLTLFTRQCPVATGKRQPAVHIPPVISAGLSPRPSLYSVTFVRVPMLQFKLGLVQVPIQTPFLQFVEVDVGQVLEGNAELVGASAECPECVR